MVYQPETDSALKRPMEKENTLTKRLDEDFYREEEVSDVT